MDIDISSPQDHSGEAVTANTYIEPSATNTSNQLNRSSNDVKILPHIFPPSRRLVEPVLTSRFTPTCSDELLTGLGEISADQGAKIQKSSSGSERSGGVG